MIEIFSAQSDEIAGLSRLVGEIGTQTSFAPKYFDEEALPRADFAIGTLSIIRDPFRLLEGTWRDRHGDLSSKCTSLGEELNRAAWLYDDQERKTYDAINSVIELRYEGILTAGDPTRQAIGHVPEYDVTVDYGAPDGIDYPPPATIADDFADVIREAGGWVADIDHFIEVHTGRSPIRDLLNPIGGNWNEVKRLGSAFRIAGEAMENAGLSLEGGAKRVGETWDGAAASAFDAFAHDQVEAMKWEGPCGRVIEAASNRIADEMKKSVISVVAKLKELLDKEVDVTDGKNLVNIALKKVPFLGPTYQIGTVILIIKDTIELVEQMVTRIQEVTDAFAKFISLVTSPSGYLNEQFDRALEPLTDAVEKTKLGIDIKNTADSGPMMRAPKNPFDAGDGADPWADAV